MTPAPLDRPMADSGRTAPDAGSDVTGAGRPQPPQPRRPVQPAVREIGGPKGPEPTRYGDWEKGGRCTDF
jgi:Protein of unknown function (DUF1674)